MESLVMTEEFGMDEILAQSEEIKPGTLAEGTVVGQTDSHVLVNVGLKQEAQIPLKEFGGVAPAVGEKLSLLILRVSGPEGRPVVSFRQARERANWDKLAESFKKQEIIEGRITQKIKGGFTIDIGLDAFMPGSQFDDKPASNPDEWVGKTVRVQILEMDKAKGNVLVSRRRVVEQEKAVKRAETLEKIAVGQTVTGRVTGLTNFGAFVDIGGIEGLLHVSDLAWNRIDNPGSVLKVGQEIEVKILKHDAASHRISLGRKQLLAHPWEGIESKLPIGSVVHGKVTGLADFGAFVEIAPGIEGLVHVSELSWTERVKKPSQIVKTGQEVDVKIIGIDREKEKISLSLRRTGPSPWDQAFAAHPIGSKVEGEVTHIAAFGAFVKIPEGVEALLKTQDLAWNDKGNAEIPFKVGDKVTALVLEINPQQERMSLGLKQLTPDPLKQLKIGQEVSGTVVKVVDFGMFVRLESGVEGLVRSSEMRNDRSMFDDRDRRAPQPVAQEPAYKEGEIVTATVIKVNRKDRKVELSVRRYEKNQERELLRKYSDNSHRPTLGEATGWQDDL